MTASENESENDSDWPPAQLIATTSIWADVTRNVACGGLAEVDSILPLLADPHDFEPSLADRARLDEAQLIVANGLRLEEGLIDTLASVEADGTPIFYVADHVTTIEFAHDDEQDEHEDEHDEHEDEHDEHEDEHDEHEDEHDDEQDEHDDHDDDHEHEHEHEHEDEDEHEDEHEDEDEHEHDEHDDHARHDHGPEDPHVWLDPVRVAQAVEDLAATLVDDLGLDADRVETCLETYLAELTQLHDDITETLQTVPAARRKLVTNHDALGYFAERYGFEVIGTIIPGLSTLAEPSPAGLEKLIKLIDETGVPAIFAEELGGGTDLAEALAGSLEDVQVASLYTGALGPEGSGAESYLAMMSQNAWIIAEALGG